MNRAFEGSSTGWMRVAELDVNNCPPRIKPETTNSVDTCVVTPDNAGCTEILYPAYIIKYTNITGQIRGYLDHPMALFHTTICQDLHTSQISLATILMVSVS